MDTVEKFWVAFFGILIVLLATGLVGTLYLELQKIEACQNAKVTVHLPTLCHKYYNDGTDRWIECMGVGKE